MTVDAEKLERGWALIAEGAQTISLAYAAIEQSGRAASPALRAPDPADTLPFDEEPPTADQFMAQLAPQIGGEVIPDTALGRCPAHNVAWTVKAAGISKNGKPYRAFWTCNEKANGEFCKEKPIPAWANSHPAERQAIPA